MLKRPHLMFVVVSTSVATVFALLIFLRHDATATDIATTVVSLAILAACCSALFSLRLYRAERASRIAWALTGAGIPLLCIVGLITVLQVQSYFVRGPSPMTSVESLLNAWMFGLLVFGWLVIPGAIVGLGLRRVLDRDRR